MNYFQIKFPLISNILWTHIRNIFSILLEVLQFYLVFILLFQTFRILIYINYPDLFNNWQQLPFVFIISLLGWYLAVKLKIPGPTIIGPMIFSALIHIFEIVEAMPMYIIVIAVQILLGSALGCLFKNITLKEISGPVLAGLVTTLIAVIPLVIIYFILVNFGYDPLSILLAFSPGGQSEMNILALSVGADMSFISPHHMLRVFMVIIFAGILHKIIKQNL